jgi:hypothetical protein
MLEQVMRDGLTARGVDVVVLVLSIRKYCGFKSGFD